MTLSALPQSASRSGTLVGGTLLGAILAAAGVLAAYLTIATPLVSRLVPAAPSGSVHVAIGFGVGSFALVAGGALLVSGTSRLASTLATLRGGQDVRGPAARALVSRPDDVVVVSGAIPGEGEPIPELVIGAFGVAVIHARSTARQARGGRGGDDSHVGDRWRSIEEPLDAAMRDADRVRRWVSEADLDFVVHVHAAVVVTDRTLPRSPTCAVISAEQIPAWIASLTRQRTLTAGRRARLLAMARPSANARAASKRDW